MNSDFKLNVLVTQEPAGDKIYWVAQCLQYDIVTQADSLHELQCAFMRQLTTNILLALKRGVEPLSNLKPAPVMYWEMYEDGTSVGRDFPVSVPGDRIPPALRNLSSRIPRGEASMRLAATV